MSDTTQQDGDKLLGMLCSKDPEMFQLGLTICREQFPGIWAAMVQYSGLGDVNEQIIEHLSRVQALNIGSVVRYRGLDGTPDMVIAELTLEASGKVKGVPQYKTTATCKYWNKSKQEFTTVRERVEVLEIIPRPIKQQK